MADWRKFQFLTDPWKIRNNSGVPVPLQKSDLYSQSRRMSASNASGSRSFCPIPVYIKLASDRIGTKIIACISVIYYCIQDLFLYKCSVFFILLRKNTDKIIRHGFEGILEFFL